MLPQVLRLTGLDVYRDGGSLSVSFVSDEGHEYCLLFPIDNRSSEPGFTKYVYRSPLLDQYTRDDYKSPTTGVTSPDWKKRSSPVSWSEARILLEELRPHLEGFVDKYLWVFGWMQEAAAKEGHLQRT